MKTDVCDILMIHYKRGEQILVARSPWRLNVVRYLLIFVDPQSLTYFITPSRRLEFCSVHTNFFWGGKFVHPCVGSARRVLQNLPLLNQINIIKRVSSSSNVQDTLGELRFQQLSNSSICFKLSESPLQWNSPFVKLHFIVEQTQQM